MGAKISVDSATMFNKGLEIIEACHLFDLPETRSMCWFIPSRSFMAWWNMPMAAAGPAGRAGYAHADRPCPGLAGPDGDAGQAPRPGAAFRPDLFRILIRPLSRSWYRPGAAFNAGGCAPAVFNAANEVAVEAFLNGKIGFLDIRPAVTLTLARVLPSGPRGIGACMLDWLGSGALTLVAFIAVMSFVVVIHELGHYWAGRWCGVHAEAFSIGFGPTLASPGPTSWARCGKFPRLPLGGYVQFRGDANAASAPDHAALEALRRKHPNPETVLHFKPVHQRAFIVAAGPHWPI
jgi:hypothetical protein